MTELLNIVQQGDQETSPKPAQDNVKKTEPNTPSPETQNSKSNQPSSAGKATDKDEAKNGVTNVNMDHYGLDEIRLLKARPSPKRSALKIGFYTVDAAKLLIDLRRENKRQNRTNYQKGLEGFDRNLPKLLNCTGLMKQDTLLRDNQC